MFQGRPDAVGFDIVMWGGGGRGSMFNLSLSAHTGPGRQREINKGRSKIHSNSSPQQNMAKIIRDFSLHEITWKQLLWSAVFGVKECKVDKWKAIAKSANYHLALQPNLIYPAFFPMGRRNVALRDFQFLFPTALPFVKGNLFLHKSI